MRLAVLTSGGDSPGMNAALRTIIVASLARGHEVMAFRRGYEGLLKDKVFEFQRKDLESLSSQGGTILGSARSKTFPTPEGQEQAHRTLQKHGLDALVVIGGNGSLAGAHLLASAKQTKIIGIPASIDNDVGHCGMSIGTDTAVNTIVEACDRISDTARAHRRAFIVEVMGRDSGFLAMRAGISAEADAILYGEKQQNYPDVLNRLRQLLKASFGPVHRKKRVLILKAEGVKIDTNRLITDLRGHLEQDVPDAEIRATILGHIVRGGRPSAFDRTIAQRLGFGAVMACEAELHDVMLSWEPPGGFGTCTQDPCVSIVSLSAVLEETKCLIAGTSPVIKQRLQLLNQVESLLAF